MYMKKIVLFFNTLCLILGFGLSASYADSDREERHHRKGHKSDHFATMLNHLNLNEGQRNDLRTLLDEQKEANKELSSRMKELYEEVHQLKRQKPLNKDRLIKIGGEMGEIKMKMGLQRQNFYDGLEIILNDEQKRKFKEIRDRMKHSHRGGFRKHDGDFRRKEDREKMREGRDKMRDKWKDGDRPFKRDDKRKKFEEREKEREERRKPKKERDFDF